MEEKILNTLKELLNFKTYMGNEVAFDNIFNYIENKMNKSLYIKNYIFNKNKAMVISNCEDKNLDIIFCTHIDVVPIEDYGYHEDDENIYGRGTIDMKGSVAVLLELFNNLKTNQKVALFITSDEEQDGNCVYELLKKYRSALAIIPDGGTNFNFINEEKGLFRLELTAHTETAHSSQPFNGKNAIVELMDVYQKIIQKYPLPQSEEDYITSVNLSRLNGGTADNQVPGEASMVLDIRHTSKDSKEEILDFIKAINKDIEVEIMLEGNVFETDLNNENIINYINVCEELLERKVKIAGCETTSDAVYFSDVNIPTIIMNPDGYYAHHPNEYVNKKSLVTLYKIYEKFLERSDMDETEI